MLWRFEIIQRLDASLESCCFEIQGLRELAASMNRWTFLALVALETGSRLHKSRSTTEIDSLQGPDELSATLRPEVLEVLSCFQSRLCLLYPPLSLWWWIFNPQFRGRRFLRRGCNRRGSGLGSGLGGGFL